MQDVTPKILDFWFGAPNEDGTFSPKPFWFKSTAEDDVEIGRLFGDIHEAANAGAFDATAATSDDFLAVVIVLDQFSRNMFRGTPAAFASDERALTWARRAVAKGFDVAQPAPHRRMFFYLPYEHSESLADQDECVRLMAGVGDDEYLRYAHAHRDVIAEFGRFPHRNMVLGRQSTPEEEAYLQKPGAGF